MCLQVRKDCLEDLLVAQDVLGDDGLDLLYLINRRGELEYAGN